jgi:hypothetical protein
MMFLIFYMKNRYSISGQGIPDNLTPDRFEDTYPLKYNQFRADYVAHLQEQHLRGVSHFLNTFISYFNRTSKGQQLST